MLSSIDWEIVLIDDEEDIRQVLSIVLSDAGYKVRTAPDGETGLRLCKENPPQIVITDIRMPGIDGIQVLETLKKSHPNIQVIVITAFGDMDMATTALTLDASDFVAKPISDDAILISVKRAQHRYLSSKQIKTNFSATGGGKKRKARGAKKSEAIYDNLVESSMDGALVCDGNEMIIALNSSLELMLGYKKSEVCRKIHLGSLFPENEKQRFNLELKNERFGRENRLALYETRLIDKSGTGIPVQMTATLLSDKKTKRAMICFFKDMRKKTILCEQWIQLIDQLNIGAFTIDLDRRITSFNRSVQSLTGLKESKVIGKDCREVFSDVPCYAKCPSHVGGDNDSNDLSVEIVDQSDVSHLVTRLSATIYDPGGEPSGCLTLLQDHAALADLINRLNYEERSLKMILDNLDIGIFTVNRGGHITFFNRAAEVISGYNRRQLLGRPCPALFRGTDTKDPALLKESMTLGESRTNRESVILTPDGEVVPIRADYMPLHSDQGKIVGGLATIQDLTLAHQFNQFVSNRYTFHSMIGKEPSMQKIFKTVEVVAKSNATILIEGATGTGKDVLASVIHSASKRADKPMVKVNCAALPDNLLESELFGYIKGAFTGADRSKPGRFQEADKGTIFLDEIGDMPLPLQAKLLHVLEDQEFYPLGGRSTVKVDVRIIAATNRGLKNLVKKRQFRKDLFYRLNVIQFELPPLKERGADIPLLIRHIIRKLCTAKANSSCEISKNALKILLNYDYPGNVRELQNILEHALIVCQDDMIEPEHLPDVLLSPPELQNDRINIIAENAQKNDAVSNLPEREKIFELLRQHQWNKGQTAKALGIDRTTLWRKMKRLGINRD
ncbi:MAG: PAS domain S-box protein [Deltaproteobacteria bacterium]|nr:PAS domain S-box protein [Deltaproteobacteria bacterium]